MPLFTPTSIRKRLQRLARRMILSVMWTNATKNEPTTYQKAQYWPVKEWTLLLKKRVLTLDTEYTPIKDSAKDPKEYLALNNDKPLWDTIACEYTMNPNVWFRWGTVAMSVGNTHVLDVMPKYVYSQLGQDINDATHPDAIKWWLMKISSAEHQTDAFKALYPTYLDLEHLNIGLVQNYIDLTKHEAWTYDVLDRALVTLTELSSPPDVQKAISKYVSNMHRSIHSDIWTVLDKHTKNSPIPLEWIAAIHNIYVVEEYQTPEYGSLALYAVGLKHNDSSEVTLEIQEDDIPVKTNPSFDALLHTWEPKTFDELYALLPVFKQALYKVEPLHIPWDAYLTM